jgi:transposase InsO family protein
VGDGLRCDPLTISDARSRFLVRCDGVTTPDEPTVRPIFESAFREFGLPNTMRRDNGPPFASMALGRLSRLSVWWVRLGIRLERIEPGHPEQNGRHERMHRTLKQETASPSELTLPKLIVPRRKKTRDLSPMSSV